MTNNVLETIMNRRSIRNYKDEQLSEEETQAILDAGIQAPSANNSQSWHFTVIQNKNLIDFISDKSKEVMRKSDNENIVKVGQSGVNIFYNAPTVVIVSGKEEVQSSLVDCSAAIENMLIAAESIGVGSVWIGFVRFFFSLREEVKRLDLPKGYVPYYAVALGHKKDDNKITGPSNRNKNVVNYIK
ncbi:MAG: nitroreductase [Clostridiaceae bacterium]|jgi:nitroreductase|nr:nitroreductase [Clostridiaceae bacterium]